MKVDMPGEIRYPLPPLGEGKSRVTGGELLKREGKNRECEKEGKSEEKYR
jgi:hypothetical protein